MFPSIKEQHELITSGKMDQSNLNRSRNVSKERILNDSYELLKRVDPMKAKKMDEDTKREKLVAANIASRRGLYSLNPNEIKEFANEEDEERYEKNIYHKNPKEVEYERELIDTEAQFKRNVDIDLSDDDAIADLKNFMRQF